MENKAQTEKIKEKTLPTLKGYGVKKAAIFGSYAKGENSQNSDIDILVEIKDDISLLDLAGLKIKLEDTLGREVDLVEYETIKPELKKEILDNQVPIL